MATLSATSHLFFVFALLLTVYNAPGYSEVNGKMSPVKYKPFDAGLLYNITTANEAFCSAVCIQHPACVISLYRQADSSCCGYSTKYTTNIELEQDVKAWQITYQGCSDLRPCVNNGSCIESGDWKLCNCPKTTLGDYCELVNVATLPDIQTFLKCKASSELDGRFACDKMYDDGPITESSYYDWASSGEGEGAWIEIIFPNEVRIERIQLWYRCALKDQAKKVQVEFSDRSSLVTERTCDGGDNWASCEESLGFQELALTTPKTFTWIRLTILETCVSDYANVGFREMKCFGQVP